MTSPTAAAVPPGPSMLYALSQLGTLRGDLGRVPAFLEHTSRDFGPVSSWRMPRARWWLFDDAVAVEQIFTANSYEVAKGRGIQRMRRLLG